MTRDNRASGGADVRAFDLRPVQVAALEGIAKHWRNIDGGDKRALVILPTGVGKTITALEAVRRAVERSPSCRVLWIAHRDELITQPFETIHAVEHFHPVAKVAGIVKGNRNDVAQRVVFSSVQTLRHRAAAYLEHGRPSLVVVDEAHHYAPGSSWYSTVLGIIGADTDTGVGGGHVIGLTATPQRGDNVALSAMWGASPAFFYGISDAMKDGYLLSPTFEHVPMEMSESLQEAMETCNADGASDVSKAAAKALLDEGIAEHTAEVVASAMSEARGHVLVYCASVAQVTATAEAIKLGCGVEAGTVTGDTPDKERKESLQAFMRGELRVLVNCDVLTEGTDLPIADTIVLARPCGSKALYVQIVGRGARLYPGQQTFRVLDILGASKVHDLEQAPVLDVGDATVDERTVSAADFSLAATEDIETPYYVAPARSLWTADVIEQAPRASADEPWSGVARLRGPYQRSLGGRPMGALMDAKDGEERPELIVEVGPSKPWSVYHAIRIARRLTMDEWAVAWVSIYDDCMGVDVGKDGSCYLVQHVEDASRWWPVRIPYRGRKPRPLASSAVSFGVANLIVRDVVRRSDSDSAKLILEEAAWRDGPVTDGQRRMLALYEIEADVKTKGEATMAITRAILVEKVDRYGLRRGWQP